MWARAVKWFASYHCLTNKQSFEALALSLKCIPQSNDRRDVIESIVREAETAERPFDALLDNVVATQRKLAEKDLLVILEGIKKSDEPPSVKYRRLAAVAADETQQLSLWKSMLGPLQQHLTSMYLDLKPDALIDEVLKRADDLVAIERATMGPSTSVASRHCCSINHGETLQGTAAGPSVLAASQQCYPTDKGDRRDPDPQPPVTQHVVASKRSRNASKQRNESTERNKSQPVKLVITDKNTDIVFTVDTGSCVSIIGTSTPTRVGPVDAQTEIPDVDLRHAGGDRLN
ncbi:hypothetical protein Ciccas_009224, partial [Cichlidogyrus casuarinus]